LLVNLPSFDLKAPACPSTPKVLRTKERAPTPFLSVVFTFGLVVESIKELRGASLQMNITPYKEALMCTNFDTWFWV